MAFDVQSALSEILEDEQRQKAALLPATHKPENALPGTPLQIGRANSKGKHLGKVAMQKIALCQHIEHGASHRADLIVKSGWSHTVTLKILNTLVRSGYVSESDNGVLSLNNITYQLIDRLIQAGHLVVAGSHSRKGA